MRKSEGQPKFKTREEVDFVIVGSGAAGGVLARELSTNGFSVVVMEQGQYRTAADFKHDEMDVLINDGLVNHPVWNDPQTFRKLETQTAVQKQDEPPPAYYARGVGGSSVHFTANYWRFHQSDFMNAVCSAQWRAPVLQIGRSVMKSWSLIIPKLSGSVAFRVHQGRLKPLVRGLIQCHLCRSNLPVFYLRRERVR